MFTSGFPLPPAVRSVQPAGAADPHSSTCPCLSEVAPAGWLAGAAGHHFSVCACFSEVALVCPGLPGSPLSPHLVMSRQVVKSASVAENGTPGMPGGTGLGPKRTP